MKTAIRRSIASLLIVSVTGLGMPAHAGTVSTEETIAAKRDRVAALLDRGDVRAQLEVRGVSASDAQARVQAMTDEELAQLAGRIDALPAGGDGRFLAFIFMLPILAVGAVVVVVGSVFKAIGGHAPSQDKPADDHSPAPEQAKGTWQ